MVNANLTFVTLDTPVVNQSSASDRMMTIVHVMWKGQHLWSIAEDRTAASRDSVTRYHLYAAEDKCKVLCFSHGGFPSREAAEAKAHSVANEWEAFIKRMWFLPRTKEQPCET